MQIKLKAAKVPFNIEVGSTVVEAVADFSDPTLTKAMKMIAEGSAKMAATVARSEERGVETDEDYEEIIEAVEPLVVLVIGREAYEEVVVALGGSRISSATQLTELYSAIAVEVGERLGNVRNDKVSKYLSDAV